MTKTELKTTILVRSGKTTTSAYMSDSILNNEIDIAHRWAAGYKKWPFTEGKLTTTFASLVTSEEGYLRGEYPEGWKADSIRSLTVGGYKLQKLNWEDFQQFIENNSGSSERVFTDFARSYYINPNLDVSGSTTARGQYTPASLDSESTSDQTVFADDEDGNEAIIEKVLAVIFRRDTKETEALNHEKLAGNHLDKLWEKISAEQFAYQSKDRGMFERIDVVSGNYNEDDINTDQF